MSKGKERARRRQTAHGTAGYKAVSHSGRSVAGLLFVHLAMEPVMGHLGRGSKEPGATGVARLSSLQRNGTEPQGREHLASGRHWSRQRYWFSVAGDFSLQVGASGVQRLFSGTDQTPG